MPQVGFEPTIPLFERAKTVHDLARVATVIGTQATAFNYSAVLTFTQPLPDEAWKPSDKLISFLTPK
jgi:hypothetical protein